VPREDARVVVLTGATSGIGRGTAVRFASRGEAVVLAARRESALQEVARECERAGGRALAVPTDVADERQVRELARRAVEEFGGFDVWVNNAGVVAVGRFEDTPMEAHRRVVETNLLGAMHGSRAAVEHFRTRGRGVLINVSSGFGAMPSPYQGSYVATKFGVRGLSASLRQELRGTKIRVCAVLPAAVDTPVYRVAANYTGRALAPLRPLYTADQAAKVIVRCADRPRREAVVGRPVWAGALLYALLPGVFERVAARSVEVMQLRRDPAPPTPGHIFQPSADWATVSGDWRRGGAGARRTALLGLGALATALLARAARRSDTARPG
jgi:short-subunit dehydrogenase